MPQRIVAVDLSPRVARVVVLETSLRQTTVAAVTSVPVDEGADREQVLTAVRGAVRGSVDSLVLAVDPRVVSTRLLRFPFGDLRKLESAVAFELEGQVPYDLEDTALAWHVVARTPTSMEALTAVIPKKALTETIADAEAAGLEVRAVVPGAATLLDLAPRDGNDPIAVAALGETTTHLVVGRGGDLRFSRTLRAGGADLDRTLARVFGVELAAAKEAKEREVRIVAAGEEVDARGRSISDAVVQGLTPVVTGLATSFKALAAADAPRRLFLTGGLSRLPGLVEYLTERLGIAVELLDLQAALASVDTGTGLGFVDRFLDKRRGIQAAVASPSHPKPAIPPEFALALGMALALARAGRGIPLNFRRGVFAYQGDIQLYRGQVTRVAVGVGAVILLAIAGSIVRYTTISTEEQRIDAGFCAITRKIVGREICDPTAALATMRQAPGAGEGVIIPPYSAASLLEMMSRAIGANVDVSFEDLEIRVDGRAGEPDRITGKGEALSFETTEEVGQSLKRDLCVQEVEVGKQRKTRDGGRVEFALTVKVSCPAGAMPGSSLAGAQARAGGSDPEEGEIP